MVGYRENIIINKRKKKHKINKSQQSGVTLRQVFKMTVINKKETYDWSYNNEDRSESEENIV